MSGQGHPLVSNERRGNPYTTWQTATGSKTSLYPGTMKELHLYTQVTYMKNKLKVNTKQYIQRTEIPERGKKCGVITTLPLRTLPTVEKYYTIKHIHVQISSKSSESLVTTEIKKLNINYTKVQTITTSS